MHAAFLRLCPVAVALVLFAAPAAAEGPALAARIAATEAALMADPRRALTLARETAQLAAQAPSATEAARGGATAKWLEAEALIGLNRADEAAVPAQAAARLIAGAGAASKLAGDIERTLGAIAAGKGDLQQALHRYQAAYRIFTAAGERRSRSIALLDVGQVYWDAGDYTRMLQYFGQAEELMPRDDAQLQLALYNARGEVLRATRRYPQAEAEFQRALKAAETLNSDMLQVRILTNLAIAQALANRLDAASQSVRRGLALSRRPDVAEWRPYLLGAAARIAARRGDAAGAARLLDRAFAGVNIAKTEMSYREMHELAAATLEAIGRKDEALRHLRAFQRLDKEAQSLIATNSAQLMAAQFDFTNQNLRISQLKQGQLQRDIQIERQRSRYRTNLFVGLLTGVGIVLALLAVALVSIRRSRDRVRAANTELEGTNEQLESALKAKSAFLATTSHEIRTPLNGILGMTQVLLADRRVDAAVREKIEVVHGAGEAMQALVDDLLDVAKLEHGGLTLAVDRTDVRQLLLDATRLWRAQAESKGVALAMAHDPLPQALMTDGARVRQIVFNLLSNAVKFTPQGRVDLRCTLEPGEGSRATLVITVADSGIGIAPEHHAHIFEAFSQVDGGTTRQFSGTGLGLSIVSSLAQALGGTIAVTSALGEGSTFVVRLPVEMATDMPAPAAVETPGLAAASVLVVDANPATQGLLRVLLMGQAAAVDACPTLDDAVARVEAGGIDLVVADAGALSGDVGAQLAGLRRLAGSVRARDGRLSILQATGQTPSIADLFTVGADQLIAKPIDLASLIDALSALWTDDAPVFVAPALIPRVAA
jgi:signal transduction histidine kinase